MKTFVASLAIVLLCSPLLQADPLDRKQISAKAKWLAHMDFDAGRDTTVGKRIHEHCMKSDKCQEKLKKMQEMVGFDPRKDLHSMTIYGTKLKKDTGVVLLHAHADKKKVMGLLKKAKDLSKSSYRSHTLFTWTKQHGHHKGKQVTGCFYASGHGVFGADPAEVKAALDVIDGESANLGGSKSPLAAGVADGTVMLARAIDLDDADCPVKSHFVKQSERFSFAAGEADGKMFWQAAMQFKTAETAGQVRAIIDGFRAMVALKHGSDADKAKLLKALSVTTADQVVTLEWRADSAEVIKMAEKRRAAWKAKIEKMKKDGTYKKGEHHKRWGHWRHHRHHGHHGHHHHKGKDCEKCKKAGKECEDCKKNAKECEKCKKDGKQCEKCKKSNDKKDKSASLNNPEIKTADVASTEATVATASK